MSIAGKLIFGASTPGEESEIMTGSADSTMEFGGDSSSRDSSLRPSPSSEGKTSAEGPASVVDDMKYVGVGLNPAGQVEEYLGPVAEVFHLDTAGPGLNSTQGPGAALRGYTARLFTNGQNLSDQQGIELVTALHEAIVQPTLGRDPDGDYTRLARADAAFAALSYVVTGGLSVLSRERGVQLKADQAISMGRIVGDKDFGELRKLARQRIEDALVS